MRTTTSHAHPAVARALEDWRSRHPRQRPEQHLDYLQLNRAQGSVDLTGIAPKLDGIKFEQWSDAHPADVAGRSMTDFKFWDTDLTTIDWVADFPDLWGLDLRRTLVTDLRPIVDHPSLFSFQYQACPFDEHSWYEVLPNRPRYRGIPKDFPESAWKICRTLHEAGLPVVTFVDNYGELRLSQGCGSPGVSR